MALCMMMSLSLTHTSFFTAITLGLLHQLHLAVLTKY